MEKLSLDEIGWFFVQEYYTFLNREPERLHCFYTKKSTFVHGDEGEIVKSCSGQQEIHRKILELGFSDCKVLVSNVDSQASISGGIIIQVLGEMSNCDGPSRKFAQTFFLAEQPNGYFVLNDIFRYLKEDMDDTELCNGECHSHSHSLDFGNNILSSCGEINNNTQHVLEENYPTNVPILLNDSASNLQSNQLCATAEPLQKSAFALTTSTVNDHHEPYEKEPLAPSSEKIPSVEHTSDSVQNAAFGASESQSIMFQSSISSRPKTWADLFNKAPAYTNKSVSSIVKPTAIQLKSTVPSERPFDTSVSVFVKNVKDRISEEDLRHALTKFGTIRHIEIKRERNCALVYFETTTAVTSAIAANLVKIDKDVVLIEERRNNRDKNRNINGERRIGGREHTKYRDEKRVGNDRRGYMNKDKGDDKK